MIDSKPPYLQYFDNHFFIVCDVYGFKHFTIFASP